MQAEKDLDTVDSMHVEDISTDGLKDEAAHHAAAEEHSQTLWQALKEEPKSVLWSVAVSTAM